MYRPKRHVIAAAAILTAIGFSAPSPRPAAARPAAADLRGPEITLAEAVDRTLRASYRIRLAEQSVESRRGVRQQSAGLFDGTLFVDSGFTFRQVELLAAGRNEEVRRRIPLEFLAIATLDGPPGALDRVADNLERGALPGTLLADECSPSQTLVVVETVEAGEVIICLSSSGSLEGVVLAGDLAGSGLPDLQEILRVLQILDALGEDFEQDLLEDLRNAFSDLLRELADVFRQTASALRLQRQQLGALPREEQFLDLRFETGYRWHLRNGIAVTASLLLNGRERNFSGKPLDPAFGDSLLPNTFTVSSGVKADFRLGKGRGRIATGGPEMASVAALRAEQHLLVHTVSQETLATVDAYWRLAAEQERLAQLQASAGIQDRVLDTIRKLIAAEELPRVEIHRTEARHAAVRSQVAAVRRQIVDARLALVRTMGQSVPRSAEAPLAADPLPAGDQLATDAEAWVERALDRRHDLRAAAETARASDLLARTAEANLRRTVDLALNVSYGGYHESFDRRLYNLGGYRDAASGRISGPSYGAALRFALPFKNDVARGRLVQAEAARARTEISERDLQRRIRLRLHDLVRSLELKRRELTRLREAVDAQERTLEATLELLRAGEGTVIDLLTTEEQLTAARLARVEAQRDVAILEARILFESAQLLIAPQDLETFDPRELELAAGDPGSESRPPG